MAKTGITKSTDCLESDKYNSPAKKRAVKDPVAILSKVKRTFNSIFGPDCLHNGSDPKYSYYPDQKTNKKPPKKKRRR